MTKLERVVTLMVRSREADVRRSEPSGANAKSRTAWVWSINSNNLHPGAIKKTGRVLMKRKLCHADLFIWQWSVKNDCSVHLITAEKIKNRPTSFGS